MSRYLQLDMRNAVKVGGTTLPGILTSLSVTGSLEIAQDQLIGTSAYITSVRGFTTATVALEITLLGSDDERESQLRTINEVFMVNPADGTTKGIAQSWRVVNPHLDARRIRQMLFVKLDSRDGNDDDSTTISLEFREILSEQARIEQAAQQDEATDSQTGTVEMPGLTANGATPGTGATTPPTAISPFQKGDKDPKQVISPPSAREQGQAAGGKAADKLLGKPDFTKPEALLDGDSLLKALKANPGGLTVAQLQSIYLARSGIGLNDMLYKMESSGVVSHQGTGTTAVYKVAS